MGMSTRLSFTFSGTIVFRFRSGFYASACWLSGWLSSLLNTVWAERNLPSHPRIHCTVQPTIITLSYLHASAVGFSSTPWSGTFMMSDYRREKILRRHSCERLIAVPLFTPESLRVLEVLVLRITQYHLLPIPIYTEPTISLCSSNYASDIAKASLVATLLTTLSKRGMEVRRQRLKLAPTHAGFGMKGDIHGARIGLRPTRSLPISLCRNLVSGTTLPVLFLPLAS
ncbi:uncharacterized protein B0T15DRAFT_121980 [Chaetomium strumarium]|uniref:Uncharacterized protein n=1 Tax=Chaetomium strumarium TaxID=1170767 RepID=A0AAJ0GZ81_9PEZI|nr:hypothetical protein B0T15DRAFT_121980 [Chaetomium strumarium]